MNTRFHPSQRAPVCNRGGFTLIEVIATLLLSAVVAAMLLPLIGSSLEGSRRALLGLPETHGLRTEMDAWWHHYRSTDPTDLPTLRAAINDAATASPPPSYTLLSNDWVDFDAAGVEFIPPPGVEDTLRVTLGNSRGERLTSYFFPIP